MSALIGASNVELMASVGAKQGEKISERESKMTLSMMGVCPLFYSADEQEICLTLIEGGIITLPLDYERS